MAEAALREAILGSGAGGPLTAPTPWISYSGYLGYSGGGIVLGSPAGGNKGVGTLNAVSLYINGTLVNFSNYLSVYGGTMAGILTLSGDPVGSFDAATKQYVDNSITTLNGNFANYLPKTGGTLTGPLTLAADPTSTLQAATKHYVDAIVAGGALVIPDAPSDGNVYGRQNAAWTNAQIIDVGTF